MDQSRLRDIGKLSEIGQFITVELDNFIGMLEEARK